MNQSDYRMGWAPAMLCIEDEPKKPAKPAPWYGYRGRTNDEFEVGDHATIRGYAYKGTYWFCADIREEDCVQGVRAERLAAKKTGEFVDRFTRLEEYLNRCENRARLCDQLGAAPREHLIAQRSARANKTATEVQLRMQAGVDRAKELRQLTQEKYDAAAAKLDLSMSTNWGIRYVIKDEDA